MSAAFYVMKRTSEKSLLATSNFRYQSLMQFKDHCVRYFALDMHQWSKYSADGISGLCYQSKVIRIVTFQRLETLLL